MQIFAVSWWVWVLLAALIAFLVWLWNRLSGPSGPPAGTLPPPPPYPPVSGSTSTFAGAVTIPMGRWNGPIQQARRTVETYTFTRETYNPASPGNPISPAGGMLLRFRLEHVPEENAEITDVTNGQQAPGTSWWGAITGSDGTIEVTVDVGGREEASSESSIMRIHAEELDTNGQVLRGATHEVTVVPSGQ